jgi:hypothetical protein
MLDERELAVRKVMNRHGITGKVEYGYGGPIPPAFNNNKWQHNSWTVVFYRKVDGMRKQMTVPFFTGIAIDREPQPCEVMACMIDDATGYDNANRDMGDWLLEYGYDGSGHLKEGIATFRIVEKQSNKLKEFLGEEIYEEFQKEMFNW